MAENYREGFTPAEVIDATHRATLKEVGKWLEGRLIKPLPETLLEPASFSITLRDILQLRDSGLLPPS